jgi:DNA-directed RNA polymerase specialized sigma24 family protein
MSANMSMARSTAEPADEREREQWLIAEAHKGAGWALVALETTYQPMVNGYLNCLTGHPEVARSLTRETLARMDQHFYGSSGAPSLAAWLLLTATDLGMEYLRHVRALQLAGVGGEPRVLPVPSRGGPAAWLRTALERFRPAPAAESPAPRPPTRRGEETQSTPSRGGATRLRVERTREATQRLRPRDAHVAGSTSAADPRDVLRRRVLRATLADLTPPVARCLALHLVAGLSHAEVAYVSGRSFETARAAIVEGLELFAVRYDEAMELLGISPSLFTDHALPQPGLPAGYANTETLRLREGAAPTQHLTREPPIGQPPRDLPTTIPRRQARTLPMPRLPGASPMTTPAARSGHMSAAGPDAVGAPSRRPPPAHERAAPAARPDATPTLSLRDTASRPTTPAADSGMPPIPLRSPADQPRR